MIISFQFPYHGRGDLPLAPDGGPLAFVWNSRGH